MSQNRDNLSIRKTNFSRRKKNMSQKRIKLVTWKKEVVVSEDKVIASENEVITNIQTNVAQTSQYFKDFHYDVSIFKHVRKIKLAPKSQYVTNFMVPHQHLSMWEKLSPRQVFSLPRTLMVLCRNRACVGKKTRANFPIHRTFHGATSAKPATYSEYITATN